MSSGKWQISNADTFDITSFAREIKLDPILIDVLCKRGYDSLELITGFLSPNIEDIYKSRNELLPHQDDPKRVEIEEYKTDFADFMTMVLKLGIEYEFLFFPDFLFSFEKTWESLQRIGLEHSFDDGKKIWDNIIELDKYSL